MSTTPKQTAANPNQAPRKRKPYRPRQVREVVPLPADAPRYQGTLVDEELVREGGPLLSMLAGRALELGHNRSEMAAHLKVTYGYIAQLSSGHRRAEHISAEFADHCARYLGVPKMTVLMAAGVIRPEDALERPDEIGVSLPLAIQFISRDPDFGPLMPAELFSAASSSSRLQFFVVRLYETATGRKLIPGDYTPEMIAHALDLVERRRQELMPGVPRALSGVARTPRGSGASQAA